MIIAFHKPYGVLSQFNENPDKPGQRTLAEFDLPPEFHPLGRLDIDSEGLLLLSDDKKLERELLRPRNAHTRTYLVQVDGQPTSEDVRALSAGGLDIRGHSTLPCKVRIVSKPHQIAERDPAVDPASEKRSSWLLMELSEGKNRQVRRMTAKIGCPTLRLIRISIGDYDLDDLELAKWQVLSEEQERMLFR